MDRLPSNELKMTQELIANMLDVRRAGVTEGAMKLQDAGRIRYRHGYIVTRKFGRLLADLKVL
jgi:Mn-dependent DtxR family transcriptional regulator